MAKSLLLVKEDDRLRFKGLDKKIKQFIAERAVAFSCRDVQFFARHEDLDLASLKNEFSILIVACAFNPILDYDLIRAMEKRLAREDVPALKPQGAIPGTEPGWMVDLFTLKSLDVDSIKACAKTFCWSTQEAHNNQFDIFKYKRLKMFLGLWEKVPNLPAMTISEICRKIEEEEIHKSLISYFSGAQLSRLDHCPYCGCEENVPLKVCASQPMVGFISSNRPVYFECVGCGLIYLSPQVDGDSTEFLYDEFDSQDMWVNPNPEYYKDGVPDRLRRAFALAENDLAAEASVIDLGGGAGNFSVFVKRRRPDLRVVHAEFSNRQNDAVEKAGVETQTLNFIRDEIGKGEFDLITAFEVVEHLPFDAFGNFFNKAGRALKPGGRLLFSTPDWDSPLLRMFDFSHLFAPHHLFVFSKRWLEKFIDAKLNGKFRVLQTGASSELLENYKGYFPYYEKTSPTLQIQSAAIVFKNLLECETGLQERLLEMGMGTEVIFCLEKID